MVPPGSAADAIDRARLAKMGNEVGEQALRQYLALFCALLGQRVDRITGAAEAASGAGMGVEAVDEAVEDALRAALDLHVSSAMLGAERLATTAADVAVLLRDGDRVGGARLRALRTEAEAAGAALRQVLEALGGAVPTSPEDPDLGPGSDPGPGSNQGPGPRTD
jgi:HPt (histidine-containing phosphotransfer) domain-containing protein